MTRPFLTPIPEAQAVRDAILAAIPVLETERLILRAPLLTDYETLEPIWRTDRSHFMGGPFSEDEAFLDFAQTVAGWALRGLGYWVVAAKDGPVVGLIGFGTETTDPGLEFGWMLTHEAEGKGYATEATKAVLSYAFDTLGLETFMSFISKGNTRSVALAERLGATEDTTGKFAALSDVAYAFRHKKGQSDD